MPISKKIIALLLSKNFKNIAGIIKAKKSDKSISLYFYPKNNRYLNILTDYQAFFNSINHAANFGIIIFNDKGYVVHVNKTTCQLYGYSFHEIIGMHGTTFIHPQIHSDFYRFINDVKADEVFQVKSIEIRKDGSTFYSLVEGKAIQTKYGKFLTAIVFDITKQTEKEEELNFQKTLFKKVFELSPIGYFIYDENLIITDTNEAFLKQLDIQRETFIGMDIRSIKDKKPFAMLSSIFQLKHATYEGYYTSTLSGKTIYTKAQSIPFKFKNKTFAIGVSLDLTKEKNIEKELTEKKQFYESLFNTALTGIIVTDTDENLILVNPAFAHILGYTVDEMINTKLSNYTTPRQMVMFQKQTEIRKKGKSSVYEAMLIHRNGSMVHVLINASPLKDSENKVIGTLGIIVDMTYQNFLLKQISELTLKNETVIKEKQAQLQAIINHLKMSVPLLPEVTHLLFNQNLNVEQQNELKKSLDRYLFILQNTFKQIEILHQCEKSNFKIRNKPITFEQFNQQVSEWLKQKAQTIYTPFSFDFHPITIKDTILFDTDSLLKALDFTINNIVIKHAANYLLFEAKISQFHLLLTIQALKKNNDELIKFAYFNDKTLCYQVVLKLLSFMGGTLNVDDQKIELLLPFKSYSEEQKNKISQTSLQNNTYTTKIWSSFNLMIITSDLYLMQLIESLLIPTEIHILKAPTDSKFISFLMQNVIADIVLIDDELFENPLIDYRSIIQRFLPNVPILGILKGNQKADFSYEGIILNSENFQNELFAMLSKYLEYGKPNQ
ncbi:MAG: PAS domain S-box protein [Bacteroidales bacterium]|nr:PAS domain S-box protein [Bacteroidales bacterium]